MLEKDNSTPNKDNMPSTFKYQSKVDNIKLRPQNRKEEDRLLFEQPKNLIE